LTEQRLAAIRSLIAELGAVRAADLAARLSVSRETVRRDLAHLERLGEVRRVHGGAVAAGRRAGSEPSFLARKGSMVAEKRAIGRAAASLVEPGESVFLDLGTTTLEVARQLAATGRQITLITNSVPAALACVDAPGVTVHLLGGLMRKGDRSLSGHQTLRDLEGFYADKAIIGAGGITLEAGVTDYHVEEAAVRRTMIARSTTCVVVADHTKFGVVGLAAVCPIRAVHRLVTDAGVDPRMVEVLREAGPEVTTVAAGDRPS
jgi:DeoR/GlpR family transcriptional regulator of sugar metabolism